MKSNPFTLGVASGDPSPDGFVLWTRLALDPLAEDGLGGMPDQAFDVQWELCTDDKFHTLAGQGTVATSREWAHSVHVELSDLESGREYFYRFKVDNHQSPIGRTLTAPALDATPTALHLALASCTQYEHGYFAAYRHLAEERPDLILHLGDYQYEYPKNTYISPDGNVRDHVGPETRTLANYRQRYAQYRSDLDLQAAHAAAPWVVVWDDHEVENNWANLIHEKPDEPQPDFRERRIAAFRAYYENMPLRATSAPSGVDMQLYRRIHWGQLATFHMLDTRQYRDDQACGDGWRECPAAGDPARSITGAAQEAWLLEGFQNSTARWDLLGQQVFFAQRDRDPGKKKVVHMDPWDGYAASRQRVMQGWIDAGVRNPVVLTGDDHTHWANELRLDFDDPETEAVGVELVTSSISSGGNGQDGDPKDNPLLGINPHIKFFNAQRGYVSAKITADALAADFKVVPKVTDPDSPIHIRASFAVADGDRTLHETYSRPVDPEQKERFARLSLDTMLETRPGQRPGEQAG